MFLLLVGFFLSTMVAQGRAFCRLMRYGTMMSAHCPFDSSTKMPKASTASWAFSLKMGAHLRGACDGCDAVDDEEATEATDMAEMEEVTLV